jgi:FKBP-type peptidyl-prolyl cis-trans isomerase FklB
MMNFQVAMREKQQNKMKEASEKNKAEAEAFFAENKNKEGVITLDSGLQYKVLKSGNGKSPKLSSSVEAHYAGRLIDGTEFDSSYKRGKPQAFKVTGVIKGWTEILQLMKEGDKWEVYIPSDLAYGERGSGPTIGPNAALIFEMELISVN